MNPHPIIVQMIWIIIGCATLMISASIEGREPQRRLSSSVSQLSVMAHQKSGNTYSGSEWQSGEKMLDVCEDADHTSRKLYSILSQTLAHEPQRRLSSSVSQSSVMAHQKSGNTYSGSELQSGENGFSLDTCQDEAMATLHQNLVDGISSNEQRSLSSSGSQLSVMAHQKSGNTYSGSELQNGQHETHQLVACSISDAHSAIFDYYESCGIDRCCALEEYVTEFIERALAFTRYCSLYSDNLNEEGQISISSDFSGSFPGPGLPTAMTEYGVSLQEALTQCHESCNAAEPEVAKASLLTHLGSVLAQWTEVSPTILCWIYIYIYRWSFTWFTHTWLTLGE